MKDRSRLALFLVFAIAAISMWTTLATPRRVRPVAPPSFVLPDLAGKTVRMDELRGKVVLLNLWATWCAPCVEEMPTLQALADRMAGRDFTLLAVSEDEDSKIVAPWIKQRGFTFPVLLDERGAVGAGLGITGYPETFVIDRRGNIVHHHVGYRDWSEPKIVGALETLMETGRWKLG